MSASNVFNNYNRILLQENFYNYKFHPSKRKAQKETIITLINALKDKENKNNYELKNFKFNDSLSTFDAMYNPHMLKLSEEDQFPLELINKNNKNFIINKRVRTSKTKPNNKQIDIQRYSDCVNFSENKRPNSNNIFMKSMSKRSIKASKNINVKSTRRPLSYKNKCPCCNNLFKVEKKKKKDKLEIISDEHINFYNNKNFKDSLSCFIYHINYFTSKEFENKKDNDMDIKKKINLNTDMTSNFTKNLKKIKYKEIQRTHFDPTNFYLIQKPLIPTIRGKIFKNMKRRYIRPIRNVVTSKNRPNSLNMFN